MPSQGTQLSYALGPPTGPPVVAGGVVRRSFLSSAGLTNVSVDLATGVGTMQWAAGPPPPTPLPSRCGLMPPNTAIAQADCAVHYNVTGGPGACCALCAANAQCAQWSFLADLECHLHTAQGLPHFKLGVTSGKMD